MKQYIGTKIVQAAPWDRPEGKGFKVVYADGYESWSPEAAFDEAYRPCDAMTFGLAIEAMRKGKRVQRAGWNGKGMWLAYVGASKWDLYPSVSGEDSVDTKLRDFIVMKTVDSQFVPWLASQTDMLAEDWRIVE